MVAFFEKIGDQIIGARDGLELFRLAALNLRFGREAVGMGFLDALAKGGLGAVVLQIKKKAAIQPDLGAEQGSAGLEHLSFLEQYGQTDPPA